MTLAANRGVWLGLIGMTMFALTLPFTKLAVAKLDPWFVTAGRAAVAGLLGGTLLWMSRSPRPRRHHAWPLFWLTLGNVLGFPMLLALALRHVPSSHAAVITGLLPLATALCAALAGHERPTPAFWLTALCGSALVVAFAWRAGDGSLHRADILLFAAMALASLGYVAGARLTPELGGLESISWALVAALPLTVPAALWLALSDGGTMLAQADTSAWLGFAYVSAFSMFIGFLFWFRGMALGGMARIGQLQLLQPFVTLAASAWMLGERITPTTLVFAVGVIGCVLVGRRTRIERRVDRPQSAASCRPAMRDPPRTDSTLS